jgi:hypothetical protein
MDETACQLPESPAPANFRAAESLAIDRRDQLDLGDYPSLVLLKVLEEKCGVKVFYQEFEPTGTAACSRDISFGPNTWASHTKQPWSTSRRSQVTTKRLSFLLLDTKSFRKDLAKQGAIDSIQGKGRKE